MVAFLAGLGLLPALAAIGLGVAAAYSWIGERWRCSGYGPVRRSDPAADLRYAAAMATSARRVIVRVPGWTVIAHKPIYRDGPDEVRDRFERVNGYLQDARREDAYSFDAQGAA